MTNHVCCDHLCSGNACCPCGYVRNDRVKSVCTVQNGRQLWLHPYGPYGISISEAMAKIWSQYEDGVVPDDLSVLEMAWDQQMITGQKYIDALKTHGGEKIIEAERLK